MVAAILFDQNNTAYRMGTGVATYARTLATAARQAGFGVEALVSTDTRVNLTDSLLSEVSLFDNPRRPLFPRLESLTTAIRGAVQAPFGFRPRLLARTGVVRMPGSTPAFDQTYVSTKLFEMAQAHFYVHGRLTAVRLPKAPALFHATFPLPIRVAGCPNIVTIHDLVPLRLPYMTLDNKRYIVRLLQRHLANADHIVTVSDYSRQDIISVFGVPERRITNTYQAVSFPPHILARSEDDIANEVTNLFELDPGNYYLFLGALEPKKNVGRLIDAYAASGSRRTLVIVGGQGWQNNTELERISSLNEQSNSRGVVTWHNQAELERMNDPRFANYRVDVRTDLRITRVRRISYLPVDLLVTLIRGSRAVLFPSLYEGFGLPVLEAMTLGTPVMTSNVTSLPEVAGDAAFAD